MDAGVDEAFECSGAAGTLTQSIKMVKKGGKVSLLGVPSPTVQEAVPFKLIVHDEIMITGSRADPQYNVESCGYDRGREVGCERFDHPQIPNRRL